MFRCHSKDYIDKFFVQAVDEQYEMDNLYQRQPIKNKLSNSYPGQKICNNFRECADFSTSSDEDNVNRGGRSSSVYSIFNQNIFETSKQTIKIKDAFTNGWKENIEKQKMSLIIKFLKSNEAAGKPQGKNRRDPAGKTLYMKMKN